MISTADRDELGVDALRETVEAVESTDGSVPSMPGVRRLVDHVQRDADLDEAVVEEVLDDVPRLLKQDQSSVQRLAAATGVVLVGAEPGAAEPLLDRLVPMLDEDRYERRTMETVEHLSTVGPDAVGEHVSAVTDRVDHERGTIGRHAARTVLSLAEETPETVIEYLPLLLDNLTASFESVSDEPTTTVGNDILELERNRRLEHVTRRLLVARAVAEVARCRPESAADTVIEAGAAGMVVSLLDDQQARVRAAAAGVASHVAEREPAPFEEAVQTLLKLLEDEYEVVRGGAIWTLRMVDDPQAVEGLRRASRDDPSAELRALAADGLAESDASDRN